jgi:hypothetical protein
MNAGRGRKRSAGGLSVNTLRPTRADRYAARVEQLSEMLAHLHCVYNLEKARRLQVLDLKWQLVNEMCSLFENAAPALNFEHPFGVQWHEFPAGQGNPVSSSSSIANGSSMSTRLCPLSTRSGSEQLLCTFLPTAPANGAFSEVSLPLAWETDVPAARTLSGGQHLSLLKYALQNVCRKPELLHAALDAPPEIKASFYSKTRGKVITGLLVRANGGPANNTVKPYVPSSHL